MPQLHTAPLVIDSVSAPIIDIIRLPVENNPAINDKSDETIGRRGFTSKGNRELQERPVWQARKGKSDVTEDFVSYQLDGDIAVIGLDRVAKRNAMHPPLVRQLQAAAARANEEAKAAVIFGHGQHFCGGLDLIETAKSRAGRPPDSVKMDRHEGHLGFDCIARARIPFFSALQGAVIGYGFELAATTHVRVADTTAYFGLPEALRGIFVGGGGSVRIQRLIGYARMADMMLTRRILSAEEAGQANAVQYVVPEGQALEKAKALARVAAENAPLSNWAVCNVLPRTGDMGYDDGFFLEQLGASFVFTDESMRRLTEFAEKKVTPFKPAGSK